MEDNHDHEGASKAERDKKKKETAEFEKRSEIFQVFNREEVELIACAFKSQLQEQRQAIKNIDILLNKSKFELKR